MEQIAHYLNKMTGDIFKLLPMKEDAMKGVDNHLGDYLINLIINAEGAVRTYPELKWEKEYLYVLNNLNYISSHEVEYLRWRAIILNSTKMLNTLEKYFKRQ